MFSKTIRFCGALLLLFALNTACTRKPEGSDDPKHRLNEYISESFAVRGPQDRARLSAYLEGEAKSRLDSWSDEQFRQAFVDAKRKFVKLAFKEAKAVSDQEVGITYELTYLTGTQDAQGKAHDAKVTNRKLAQMIRRGDQWYISEVRNIKELVEYQNELSLP
jgi:hypothetical protein